MKEISIFFERILQILDYYGIKSINSLAIERFKYDSSEKINRLKTPGTSPSFQILCDFANEFEEIDMRWFLTGVGEMIKSEENKEKQKKIAGIPVKIIDNNSMGFILDRYEALVSENALLKNENEELKQRIDKPGQSIPYIDNSLNLGTNIAAEPKNK